MILWSLNLSTPAGVEGSLAAVESGSDSASFVGELLVQGSASAGDSTDSAALVGTVPQEVRVYFVGVTPGAPADISGTVSATEGAADAASLPGIVRVTGTSAALEVGPDLAALTGSSPAQGSLIATESSTDTATLVARLVVAGSMVASESTADTGALPGGVLVRGSAAATETGQDTALLSGASGATGFLSASEVGADTVEAFGLVVVSGSVASAEVGEDSCSTSGLLVVSGSSAATETGDSAFIDARVLVAGLLAAVDGGADDSASIPGQIFVRGTASATEVGGDTAVVVGVVRAPGTGASASEIWAFELSNGLTAEQTLVEIHAWLNELHLIHGLRAGSPLSVTQTERSAGPILQALSEVAGAVTVTRQ